jgi:hypothetical protein
VDWSAISDLTFAQSEDAPLIFENLPSRETLLRLQNEFRRVLNQLMAHARQVATGSIAPAFFVATDEPVRPVFKRRTSGSFASWWTRAKTNELWDATRNGAALVVLVRCESETADRAD